MQQSMPLVSAIIPSYNQGPFLPEAVRSALAQSYANLEIIIVDDCSTDNSHAIALALQAERPDKIAVLKNKVNSGVSCARNAGVAAASGEFIAFLDSDDAWSPDKTKRQIEYFETHPNTGFIHGKVRVTTDETSRQWLADNANFLLKGVDQLEQAINGFCDEAVGFDRTRYFDSLMESNRICAASAMVRREAFLKAGGFASGLNCQVEDWLLWLTISMYDEVGVIGEELALYRFHHGNHTANMFARQDFDFEGCRAQIRQRAEAHDPERFRKCLKECGRA